jgi:hypothetical protein
MIGNWHQRGSRFGMMFVCLALLAGCSATVRPSSDSTTATPLAPVQTANPKIGPMASTQANPPKTEVLQADPRWFSCKGDSDCSVQQGPCAEPQAVNTLFVKSFLVYRDRMNQMIDCSVAAKPPKSNGVACQKLRCTLK